MNRHDIANQALGYDDSVAPHLFPQAFSSHHGSDSRPFSMMSRRGSDVDTFRNMGSGSTSRAPSEFGHLSHSTAQDISSSASIRPTVTSTTHDSLVRPLLTIDTYKDSPAKSGLGNDGPEIPRKARTLASPQDQLPGMFLSTTPTSPTVPTSPRMGNNESTGAYRDLSKGAVVEINHEGNPAEPTKHPKIVASPRQSRQFSISSLPLSSIEMPGLTAAAEFLPPDSQSVGKSQFSTPVLIPDGSGPPSWNNDMGDQVTGFAVASSKRNADFHALFPSLPEDDYLIETYSCAISRDLLIQGRMYVSEAHLCFHSNIFGWITSFTVAFADVVSIEKRNTAYLIPNAICIRTLQNRYLFSSLVSRDLTYSMLVSVWRMSSPSQTAQEVAASMSDASEENDLSDDDDDDKKSAEAAAPGLTAETATPSNAAPSVTSPNPRDGTDAPRTSRTPEQINEGIAIGKNESNSTPNAKGKSEGMTKREKLRRHLSKARKNIKKKDPMSANPATTVAGDDDNSDDSDSSMSEGADGSEDHPTTTCDCDSEQAHLANVVLDEVFDATPQQVFDLIFVNDFMEKFWSDNQKLFDIDIGEWSSDKVTMPDATAARAVSYTKPLNGPIGPKQTKCLITDEQLHMDFDKFCTAVTTTRTPDVPSGNNFAVRTRQCFTWAEYGRCRLYVTCAVEWTGRSMIKGVIDKASVEGQKEYYRSLSDSIREYIMDHPDVYGGRKAVTSKARQDAAVSEAKSSAESAGKGGKQVKSAVSAAASSIEPFTPSPSVLILTVLIIVLLISNVWVYMRGSPGSMRDPNNPHRLLIPTRPKQLDMRQANVVLQDEVQNLLDTLANSRRITEEIELDLRELQKFIQKESKHRHSRTASTEL